MSNLSSQDLFALIHKLSKSEKRHFKLFASRHVIGEGNKYVALFDALEKQKEYDKESLEKEVATSQLSLLQNRLYELLLKSLSSYHPTSSIFTKLSKQLHHIELLFQKGLTVQASKKLSKTRELAIRYEENMILLKLAEWEIKLLTYKQFENITESELKNILKKRDDILHHINNQLIYEKPNLHVFYNMWRGGYIRNVKELKKYEDIVKKGLLENKEKPNSYKSNYFLYETMGVVYFMKKDYINSTTWLKKLSTLAENRAEELELSPHYYINTEHNICINLIRAKKFNECLEEIEKLKNWKAELEEIKKKIFFTTAHLELLLHNESGQFEKAPPLLTKIEKAIDDDPEYFKKSFLEQTICQEIACSYFGLKVYRRSLKWLNKILNANSPENTRSDLYCFAKIFNLIVHSELGNQDLLESAVISTYRYLYKRDRLYKLETLVLQFIRKTSKYNKQEMHLAYKKLGEDFLMLKKDFFEQNAFVYFDYTIWLNEKIK